MGSTLADLVTLVGARGFLLAGGVKGPFTEIGFPGAPRTLAVAINNRRQVVGLYENKTQPP